MYVTVDRPYTLCANISHLSRGMAFNGRSVRSVGSFIASRCYCHSIRSTDGALRCCFRSSGLYVVRTAVVTTAFDFDATAMIGPRYDHLTTCITTIWCYGNSIIIIIIYFYFYFWPTNTKPVGTKTLRK